MMRYHEIINCVREMMGVDKNLDVYFLASVLSTNIDQYNEGALRFVQIGHEYGARVSGRVPDKNDRIPLNEAEMNKIGKDFIAVSISTMTTVFSILTQSNFETIEEVCQRSVEYLFDVGYQVGIGAVVIDPSEPEDFVQNAPQQKEQEDTSEFSDDSDIADFLRQLLGGDK